MNIVFCGDHGVWHALHVAAYSVLDRFMPGDGEVHFHVASDAFGDADYRALEKTLGKTGKKFRLSPVRIDASVFAGFKPLNGSLGAYYKLVLPQLMTIDRYLYLDADILCDVDLSPLSQVDLEGHAVGWVAEAPMDRCVDRDVARRLGNKPADFYFNSGVLMVDRAAWIKEGITEKCLEYLSCNDALIREQSALNVVLHGRCKQLEERYNAVANMRKHWPAQKAGRGKSGMLMHFVDYPKPWDLLGEFVHPQYHLWRQVLDETSVAGFYSWQNWPSRRLPGNGQAVRGYRKMLKDRLLFGLYRRGLITPKGIMAGVTGSRGGKVKSGNVGK